MQLTALIHIGHFLLGKNCQSNEVELFKRKMKIKNVPFPAKRCNKLECQKCFINLILIGLRQSKENNTECGGAFQRVIFTKNEKMMTRKSFWSLPTNLITAYHPIC